MQCNGMQWQPQESTRQNGDWWWIRRDVSRRDDGAGYAEGCRSLFSFLVSLFFPPPSFWRLSPSSPPPLVPIGLSRLHVLLHSSDDSLARNWPGGSPRWTHNPTDWPWLGRRWLCFALPCLVLPCLALPCLALPHARSKPGYLATVIIRRCLPVCFRFKEVVACCVCYRAGWLRTGLAADRAGCGPGGLWTRLACLLSLSICLFASTAALDRSVI